jgi:hypothetical protein
MYKTTISDLIKSNQKIDTNVLNKFFALQEKLPESARQKPGSDYRLSPPLDGKTFSSLMRAGQT